MTAALRSPLPWIGGKFYSRARIVAAFPQHSAYSTYVEVFGGAAHVLLHKPLYKHLEVYNDYSRDLVNFWMMCRNHPTELQAHIDSLPYARSLYEDWQASLFNDTAMSDMERAVRWFYVLRSSVGGIMRKSKGNWGYSIAHFDHSTVHAYHSAARLFHDLSKRLKDVQIECDDFVAIITRYERASTLFYCDPPYIGAEFYYEGTPPFTMADHERLAALLNGTPAQVALSYYPHDALDALYPVSRWRRLSWQTYKHAEKTRGTRQTATEMLLCNYEPPALSLWEEVTA